MFVLIGYLVVIAGVLGGYAAGGGHLLILWQPMEIAIICGGAIGAFVAGNTPKTLKGVGKALKLCMSKEAADKEKYIELMSLINEVLTKARQEGDMAIEEDVENPESSATFAKYPKVLEDEQLTEFLCDYLRFIVAGKKNAIEIEGLMESELQTYQAEMLKPAASLQKMADGLPAFGIVAAVMGVIHVMGSVGQVSNAELGVMIGAALVGTFLGVLLAYGFVAPLASLADQKLTESVKQYECVKVSLLAFMNGYSPEMSAEFGRKVLWSTMRPTFSEMDDRLRSARQSRRG